MKTISTISTQPMREDIFVKVDQIKTFNNSHIGIADGSVFTSSSTAFYKACTTSTSLYYYGKPTPNAMFIVHNNSNLTRIEGVHAVCTCGGDLKI